MYQLTLISRSVRGRGLGNSFSRCERGSNAVEFALVAPILFLLLLGIVYVSVYLSVGHSLAQLSADASRYAMVGLNKTERRALAQSWVTSPQNRYGFVNPSKLEVATEEVDGALKVSVTYDMTYLPPPPIVGAVINLPTRMERSSTVWVQ